VDNLCHTLVGAACARAGLTRPVPLAAATSMIAANLPDIDVLVFATEVPSVAFRRGWTHGILAQIALPALFAWLMFVIARRTRGRSPAVDASTPALGPLLVLSYVGVVSHVFLDLLNNYGVRLLMPFSGRWFYGDVLFIVDPWLWVILGAAVLAGRAGRTQRTRVALVLTTVYIVCMVVSARTAKTVVADAWRTSQDTEPRAMMVGPVLLNPFRKAVIVDAGKHYRTGTFTWFPRRTTLNDAAIEKNDGHPATLDARRDPAIAGILIWSRFPFWEIQPRRDGTLVTLRDVRFAGFGRGGFTATTVVR
jgi:inner membrane protein